MKTHDDLIYAPIITPGASRTKAAPSRLAFTKYVTSAAKAAYRIVIDGIVVATYFIEIKATSYRYRYAIEPFNSTAILAWDLPSTRRTRFTEFLQKYQIDYDSVSHLIPVT